MYHRYFYHTNDPDAELSYSHYSDPAFDGPGACIYGKYEKDLYWDYADRLQQWDYEKSQNIHNALREKYGDKRCARRIEEYLSLYYGRVVDLKCIMSGTQSVDGYPWYAYGYKFVDETNND